MTALPEFLTPGLGTARGVASQGLYARVRHPRYLAYMATRPGFGSLTWGTGIFALAFITILMY
ncbi:MAG: hypothetical protein ACRD3T_02425 [Terriglobia bacterium]